MSIVKERDDILCAEKESIFKEEMLRTQQEMFLARKCIYQEMRRQKLLSEQQKAMLRDEIMEEYEEIDYRASDVENAERFSRIGEKLETIRISDIYHSEERKRTTYSTLRTIIVSLRSIQRRLNSQVEHISKYDDWTRLSECEDEIFSSLIGIVGMLLSLKTCCFEQDREVEKIGTRAFTHKFLDLLSSPKDNKTLRSKYTRKDHSNAPNYLKSLYYIKSWEDKAECQRAILESYYERCKGTNQPVDCNMATQRYLLKDFQGDLALIVKEKRKQRNWTQQQLATFSGVERTMIAKVENLQASTSLETAIKLLTSLDMGLVICPLESVRYIPDQKSNPLENLNMEIEVIE